MAEKNQKIEQAKKELKEIKIQIVDFLEENNIDSERIKSKEDLIEAVKIFDIEKQI